VAADKLTFLKSLLTIFFAPSMRTQILANWQQSGRRELQKTIDCYTKFAVPSLMQSRSESEVAMIGSSDPMLLLLLLLELQAPIMIREIDDLKLDVTSGLYIYIPVDVNHTAKTN
jgi:hypothetical protein